jgi:hypothetical protein
LLHLACCFFYELVPCVAGRKVWTRREKASKLISQAKKIVTVLDEAFTILALENYWTKWFHHGSAQWTDSRAGNYQFMGWSDVAYARFDRLCTRLKEQRKSDINKQLEIRYLEQSRGVLTEGGMRATRVGGAEETQVEVYNQLDSEEED